PMTGPTKEQRNRWGEDDRAVLLRDVVTALGKVRDAAPEAARMTAVMTEAQALPDGPLREYLIGVRPAKSYETTEGKGARARRVKKSYTPTPELVSDHKKATEAMANAEAERKTLLKKTTAVRRDIDKHLTAARK